MSRAEAPRPSPDAAQAFPGDSELARLMREHDWAQTPLGPVDGWPQSLRTMVKLLLANRFPLLLWWGPDQCQLYNDAYRPVLGTKHPRSLGQPARECWAEIWHIIGPLILTPYRGGPATWDDDLFLEIHRHEFVEETHFTIAYSPVPDETAPNGIGGVLATVHEITQQVVQARRVAALRDLGAHSAEAKTAEEACANAAEAFGRHPRDIPFALLYLLDAERHVARLAAAAGVNTGEPISQRTVALDGENADAAPWPFADVARTEEPRLVTRLGDRFAAVPPGPWSDPPTQALVLPIPANAPRQLAGMLVLGISARLELDDFYRSFCELAVAQVAAAIANARAYEEERKRAEALAELDRAKTAFFSNVSHEFRTPLTLLLGPLEEALARPEDGLPAGERALLETAHRNALRLLKLVNSLLDFSRIEAGRLDVSYEPTDLAVATGELASVFRSAIEHAGLRLLVDCPPLPEPAYVDRDMWEKIVLNLLSNAFKHTFTGEIAVTLRATADGRAAALAVRDTGVGIPAAELPHLFMRFHRVRGAQARTYEGSGIGLALVQELARLHGGTVAVESEEGVGSTFTVTLPLGAAHLPADHIGAGRTRPSTALGAAPFVAEALRWLPDAQPTPAERANGEFTPEPVRPTGERPTGRVLLADDNADMRAYVRRLLADRYDVETAADGQAALAAAHARPPDLVLADVMMPGLDGFALLRALRAEPATRTTPVILLSARAGEEARVEGLGAGADDYLVKPFSARDLLARVEAHLALARSRADAQVAAEGERQRLHELVEQAPAAIAMLRGPTHVFALANPRAMALIGNGRAILGKPVREALPEAASQGVYELLDRVYATGEPFVGTELPIRWDRNGDGTLVEAFLNFVYQPLRAKDGAVEGIYIHVVDVTPQVRARQALEAEAAERTRAEVLLREQRAQVERAYAATEAERARLQQVLDVLPAGVSIADASGRFIMSNRAARELLGFDFTGRMMPTTDAGAFEEYGARRPDGSLYPSNELPLQRAVLQGETVYGDRFFMRHVSTGRAIPVLANSAPLLDGAGQPAGGVVVFQDITTIHDLEQQKDAFLSAVSHDLQQPVSVIRGNAQLLRRRLSRGDPLDQERLVASLTSMEEATERLTEQIAELMDVSRLQMGRPLDLRREPTDLVALARQAAAAYQGASDSRPWRFATPVEHMEASVDPARLRRVLDNLLSNAVKFSSADAEIALTLGQEVRGGAASAVLAVRDHGIGIPAADLPRVFERFYRAGNAAGQAAGTGIGLAGARQIVEQHGGSLTAQSVEGEGSTFTIRLPLEAQG